MYTLYSDKNNIFECDIQLEGASLSQAFARVIVEGEDLNLVFNGNINSEGNCRIEMPKLTMLKEGGEMKLEVIADDMYFNPWNSDFELKKSKSITVEVKQPTDKVIKENKATVKVNLPKETKLQRKVSQPKKTIKESNFTKQDLKKLLLKLRS
jgi:hypothetical protein|tara:strand:+ start:1651 stop:2109 length:459 start_codon:yes stop_codon:yes gene_type:complete